MPEEKIMTLHPQGKAGVNILLRRYEQIKEFVLRTLEENGAITYSLLDEMAVEQLKDSFDGKVSWYVVTVKLDLEARGIIERIPKTSPHQIRLTGKE